jgi:hypothetical protein
MQAGDDFGFHGSRREIGFETAAVAADAEGTVRLHREMTEVSGNASSASEYVSFSENSTAYACAERQHQCIGAITRCTECQFSRECGSGVVIGSHRDVARSSIRDQIRQARAFEEVRCAGKTLYKS